MPSSKLSDAHEEKMALMNELVREKSDAHSELSRLRRWSHYLRRQSLVEFVSPEHPRSLALGAQAISLPSREAAAYPAFNNEGFPSMTICPFLHLRQSVSSADSIKLAQRINSPELSANFLTFPACSATRTVLKRLVIK